MQKRRTMTWSICPTSSKMLRGTCEINNQKTIKTKKGMINKTDNSKTMRKYCFIRGGLIKIKSSRLIIGIRGASNLQN